jgi:hypothetical protein
MPETDALIMRGMLKVYVDDLPGAIADLGVAAARLRTGLPLTYPGPCLAHLSEAHFRRGDWDAALTHAQLATALAQDTDRPLDLARAHARAAQVLADGTYLAELKPPRKKDGPAVTVRVTEYTVHTTAGDGGEQAPEVFCLVTDLLDVEEYPALDLARAYPLRWGRETVTGHRKTGMGQGQPVLRSGDPEGVMQEMRALSAVCQAISRLTGIAVDAAGIPPDQISFPHALAAATATVAAFPP